MTTSTLQLACPTCGGDIEVECSVNECDGMAEVVSLRTWCLCPFSKEQAYDLLMDHGARQAELATERARERG
jgi:hypothetical protein